MASRDREEAAPEAWIVKRRWRWRGLAYLGLAVLCILGVAAGSAAYPYIASGYLGPAPPWHTFGQVFSTSETLFAEGCSVQDLVSPIGGVALGRPGPDSIVSCGFHGATYTGYYGTDCDLALNGPIPTVNGVLIPFGDCELSTAPLTYVVAGLFTVGAASSKSLTLYSAGSAIANMTTTAKWTALQCSMSSDNVTVSNGPLFCTAFGAPYVSLSPATDCDIGVPIQVNGAPVPYGGCFMSRNEESTV